MELSNLSRKTVSRRDLLRMAAAASIVPIASSLLARPAVAKDVSINVMTLGEGIFGQPFVDLSSEFTAAAGIKVNLITMGYNEAIQKQAAAFAARSSAYDVVQVDSIFVKGFAKAGHLQALDDFISKGELDDYFGDIPRRSRTCIHPGEKPSVLRRSATVNGSSTIQVTSNP